MNEFENPDLIKLAKKSNAELLTPLNSFIQGFMMGRTYQKELMTQIYNKVLIDTYYEDKYQGDNYWEDTIARLEQELFKLKTELNDQNPEY